MATKFEKIRQLQEQWKEADKRKNEKEKDRLHKEADKLRGFQTETTISGGKYYQTPIRMEGSLTPKAISALKPQKEEKKKPSSSTATKIRTGTADKVPSKSNILKEAFDQNETYVDKFKKGNIGGGVANFVGTGLTAAQSLYLNALNAGDSLLQRKGIPKFQNQMSYSDYDKAVAERRGARPTVEQVSDVNPLLGKAYGLGMEIATDPLELTPLGTTNDIKLAKGTAQNSRAYADALRAGKYSETGTHKVITEKIPVLQPNGKTKLQQMAKVVNSQEPAARQAVEVDAASIKNNLGTKTPRPNGYGVPGNSGIKPFSDQEAVNLSSHKGYVNGKDMDFSSFIQEAKIGKDSKNFYMGKVSDELAGGIKAATGMDVSGYNVAIRSDEVRHIFKNHGDALVESKRGQIAVNDSLIEKLVTVFDNPDEIVMLPTNDAGRRAAFELRKRINGYAIVVNGSADGRKAVQIDSYRIINKKKPSVALDAQGPEQTSKTGYRPASDSYIPQPSEKINSQKTTNINKEMTKLDKAYMQAVDNQFAIAKATKGIKTTADKDPVVLASNARNAKGTAEYAMREGLVDMEGKKITDHSLEQLLLRPKAEQEAYYDYLFHKHNIARYRQDKPVFGDQVTDKMSRKAVSDYETQYPHFKGLSSELNDFNGKLIDNWLVKSGLIDEKLAKLLKSMYPDYVPTFREGGVPGKQFKVKGLTPGKVVKEAVGGNKPIMALNKSFPAVVEKAIKSARKNEVYMGLLDAVEKNPEKMARWAKVVEETADKKYKDAITITDAQEFISKNGIDGIEDISNQQLVIDSRKGKYYVTAMRKGKPVRMEVHKDLFDGLESLNRIGNEGTLDGMAAAVRKYATNPFKALITGYNPIFGVKNMFRDIPTAYIQGTENNPIKWAGNLLQAGKGMKVNDANYQEFIAMGGRKGGFFNTEKGLTVDRLPTKALRKVGEKIGAFNEFTETLPRYGEYLGTLKREGNDYAAKQKAIYNAGEVTVNFNRHGDKTKAIDTVVPYLNPAVQGIDKAIRNLRHPMTYAKGVAMVTAPTAALYMINQAVDKNGYDQLDNRTRDTNYLIPMGSGQFIKIPKSRESGVLFGSLFERLFRLAEGQQNSFKGFGNTIATNFAPSNPLENNILAPATLNLAKNKDFAKRSIVPLGMLNDNRSPYLQYDEQTSEIAKWFGSQARNIPGFEEGLSPKQIDYLIKSYTGIIGQILQPATTKGQNPFESVIKRGFTADSLYNNEIQNEFYEAYDEAKRIKTDKNINEDIPADYVTPEEKRISVYNKASLAMSELRKEEKRITAEMAEGPAKESNLREIRQQIIDIAKRTPAEAEREYEAYKRDYIPELSMMSEKQVKKYNSQLKHSGVTPQQYRDAYLSQKDYTTDIRKAIALQERNNTNMYSAFEISQESANLAIAIRQNGLTDVYDKTQKYLKSASGSVEKKARIDAINPGLTREQLVLMYEAFDVSQGVGKYKRQFNKK